MIYPFIYTGTRRYDFRVVTSQMLKGLPPSIEQLFTEIARTMIDADDSQLIEPSWTLVKKDGYILWGMAVLNKVLGDKYQDKDKRPVRGFFGFISDDQITKLPLSISYFKEIYNTYVFPIWDSFEQTEQIVCQIPSISGFDFIEKSSRLSNEINTERNICRIFPNHIESKGLIEAVFASSEDCSIATNIHRRKQCIEFGEGKLSFANAVMSSDSNSKNIEDIKVFVDKENSVIIQDTPLEENSDITDKSFGGKVTYESGKICHECVNRQQNKKYFKYCIYGFMVLICLLFAIKELNIWEKVNLIISYLF